jgi:signal transduction histidine kinase
MSPILQLRQTIKKACRNRLFFRLLLLVVSIMAFSVVTTTVALSWISYVTFRETLRRDYSNIAKGTAGQIQAFLESAKTRTVGIAGAVSVLPWSRWQQEKMLLAPHSVSHHFQLLWLIYRDGEDHLAVGEVPGDIDPKDLDVYRRALTGQPAVSQVITTAEKVPYLWFAAPVFRLGQVNAVLLAQLNLKAVWDVLEGLQIGKTGSVHLVERSGKLISHDMMDQVVSDLPGTEQELLERLRQSSSAPLEWSKSRSDNTYYCIASEIPLTGWFVILSQRETELFEHVTQNAWLAAVIVLLIGLASAGIVWVRSKRFLVPLETLHQQVERIGRGELDARISVESEDEIGRLAKAFNRMTISLKEHIEQEIKTAQELVHARNLASLGASSSKVTHEVGNLLNNVGATLLLLSREPLSPGGKKAVQILENDALRVRTFVQNFLRFSRKPELRPARVSLESTLRELLLVFREQAACKGIQLHLDWPPDLPLANIDLPMMHQVLINLLRNSLEAIDGKGKIEITSGFDGDCLQVRIADTGRGIAPDIKEKIFEPFVSTKGKQGTGLGLPICRSIVEAHRGTIRCESEPGKGTVFIVSLPIM